MRAKCFDVDRLVGIVSQRGAYLLNALVYAALEVKLRLVTPEAFLDLFARDNLPSAAGKKREQLKRLRL